jgi:hypothetical protein
LAVTLVFSFFIGAAGWVFALGRRMITSKVIDEAVQIFVKREIYELEMRSIQASITALQLEQKTNHSDMINRLDKAVDQINKKIDLLVQ